MITNEQKELLTELLVQEQVSDVMQAMLTLARRIELDLYSHVANPLLMEGGKVLQGQFSMAVEAARQRIEVLVTATQETTAKEIAAGLVHSTMLPAGGPRQMALL